MRKLFYLAVFSVAALFAVTAVSAQSYHFIYLQSENRKPFYVKIDRQLMKSSVSGYSLLPKLINGEYVLTIGFIQGDAPEHVFKCTIKDKDVGYLIKKAGENRWVLFNLQTMETLEAANAKQTNTPVSAPKADEFSALLSAVVNDSTIRQPEKPTQQTAAVAVAKEPEQQSPALVQQPVVPVNERPAQPVEKKPAISSIRQLDVITTDKMLKLKYQDRREAATDTIDVMMELEEGVTVAEKPRNEAVVQGLDSLPSAGAGLLPAIPSPAPAKVDDPILNQVEVKPTIAADTFPPQRTTQSPMINSDCKVLASEDDFLKLRKKMAAAENEEDMLAAARKVFKTICFNTAQIRNLGVLFLKDEGRYRFFDLAYPFAADSHQYAELEKQLSDLYYINRFRAMLRH